MSLPDAIIVGAGPAGSAAATLLARRGLRVTVVDRARFPRDKPCGDYCDPGAVQALRALGCLPEVVASGAAAITTMTVVAQDASRFEAPFPSGSGLLMPRRRLDAVLVEHAAQAGAEIVEGFRVDAVRLARDSVEVNASHPVDRSIRAKLLIAADGMRSVVARRLGLRSTLPTGRYTVGAYFSGLPYTAPRGELHLGPGLYGGVAHFGGGDANVCLALPREWFRKRTPEETFAAALRSLPALADAMSGAVQASAFRCSGPVGLIAHEVVTDRVILIGDAAGQIEPMSGQGIYLALRSAALAAEVAADALARGDLSRATLGRYAQRRAMEVTPKLRVSRWLEHLALHAGLTPLLVRRLDARPALARRLLGVAGDVLPPAAVLSPGYLVRFLNPFH